LISLDHAILAAANLPTTVLSFSAGDTIFQRGAPAQLVYVVGKGALCRFRSLPGGRRSILQFLFAGDGFGYEPDGYYRDTVQALTDVGVLAAGRKRLTAASKSRCSEALFAAAARACVIAEEQSVLVRGRTAIERTALFLLEMSTRLSTGDQLVLPMSRRDISDYLGLRLETVSRAMHEFHRAKIIEIRGGRWKRIVIVLNRARLEKLASDASGFDWWKR
jgi:CRP/FNR family transcriptional regulator, nitrogen fixation regulation protein